MQLLILFFLVLTVAIVAFVMIARKGRELRTHRPLPPKATDAFLESEDGTRHPLGAENPFYAGKSPSNDLMIADAGQEHEVCIFYHRKRFAFQTPSGIPRIRVNGEEQLAGYLFDGDVLTIAGETFTFKVMSDEQ